MLVNNTSIVRERNYRFKLKDEDKLRVNPKYLALSGKVILTI